MTEGNHYLQAMNEFKDQLDATEKEKVTKLVAELREIAVKGQAADATVTADAIREKINETQQASLGLFQKVTYRCLHLELDTKPSFRFTRNATPRTRHRSSLQSQQRTRRRRRRTRPFLPSFQLMIPPTVLVDFVAKSTPCRFSLTSPCMIDHTKVRPASHIIHYNIVYFIHTLHSTIYMMFVILNAT